MASHRGVAIIYDSFASVATGRSPKPIDRYRARVNNKMLKGTMDEVKAKIDIELGSETPPPSARKKAAKKKDGKR
jgi:hypothetical protein